VLRAPARRAAPGPQEQRQERLKVEVPVGSPVHAVSTQVRIVAVHVWVPSVLGGKQTHKPHVMSTQASPVGLRVHARVSVRGAPSVQTPDAHARGVHVRVWTPVREHCPAIGSGMHAP
jgi:hypothetical protein